MELLKKNLPMIVLIALEIVVGVLLFINPELFTKALSIIVGVSLIALGVVFLVRIFTGREVGPMSWIAVVAGVVALVVGIFCTFFFNRVIEAVGVLYGVMLIIAAAVKVKAYFDLSKAGFEPPMLRLVGAFVSLVIGILMIVIPFEMINAFGIFAGICLILQAAVDIVTLVLKINHDNN